LRYGESLSVEEYNVYSAIGEEGFERLIAAFYKKIPQDEILGPMYAGRNLSDAEQRLRDFLVVRFGGPARYLEQRGHPRLRMRHFPFPIDQRARDRWIQLMQNAFSEAALPPDAEQTLRSFFDSTATFLINREEQP
jgi:hemoglobin